MNSNKRNWEDGILDTETNIGSSSKQAKPEKKPASKGNSKKMKGSWLISADVFTAMKVARLQGGYDSDTAFVEEAIQEKIDREAN